MALPSSGIGVPAPQAEPPRYGLLASIPPTKDVDPRWVVGIKYTPEGCNEGETFGDQCESPENTPLNTPGVVEWKPYVISVTETCSAFSGTEENVERVRRLLNADTERQLGAEFWDGTVAQTVSGSPNTWLADSSDLVDLTGVDAAGYIEAVSCLEQYLAANNSGQQGVIHATAQVVTAWESFRLVRREGNKVLTFQDNLVVVSPGYSGNGPSNDGTIWAYATDMPRIFLGEPVLFNDIQQIVDYTTNDVAVTMWRFALAEWQRCRHAGIQIDIDPCGPGS